MEVGIGGRAVAVLVAVMSRDDECDMAKKATKTVVMRGYSFV
jgi:hypothetical protein